MADSPHLVHGLVPQPRRRIAQSGAGDRNRARPLARPRHPQRPVMELLAASTATSGVPPPRQSLVGGFPTNVRRSASGSAASRCTWSTAPTGGSARSGSQRGKPCALDGSGAPYSSGAGIQRFGSRIQQAFEEAVRLGVSRGLFLKRGEFLWGTAMQQPPVRDRSELPAASRKFEFVAPEEIRRAILIVVEESYGIVPGEVPMPCAGSLVFPA